eukprot:15458053-Alexandrium_andersonii.AAC.1
MPRDWQSSHAPIAKDCACCGLADCGLEPASLRFRGIGLSRGPRSWAYPGPPPDWRLRREQPDQGGTR